MYIHDTQLVKSNREIPTGPDTYDWSNVEKVAHIYTHAHVDAAYDAATAHYGSAIHCRSTVLKSRLKWFNPKNRTVGKFSYSLPQLTIASHCSSTSNAACMVPKDKSQILRSTYA